jgi:hypothetical protein
MEEKENDDPFIINDINSQEFKDNKWSNKKKIIIGATLASLILVLVIIIIILVSRNGRGNDNKEDENKEEQNHDLNDKIGEIECIYNFDYEGETQILSNEFKKSSEFDIYIGDSKIKFTKSYKFLDPGEHKIKYVLYEGINMDFMFSGVSSLLSVKMESNKNAKVISMANAFENCDSLYNFQISGFNTKEL